MSYPKWLLEMDEKSKYWPGGYGYFRLLQLAKDGWNLAQSNAEIWDEGEEPLADRIIELYGDLPYPNDGAGI